MQNLIIKSNDKTNETNTETNEFEEIFEDLLSEFDSDVHYVKEFFIDFFSNLDVGLFSKLINFNIYFSGEEFTISLPDDYDLEIEEVIFNTQYEEYGIKVINKALENAYKIPNIKKLEWNVEAHEGLLQIEPIF